MSQPTDNQDIHLHPRRRDPSLVDASVRPDTVESGRWSGAVANLVALTRADRILWRPVDAASVPTYRDDARVVTAYEADYAGRRLRFEEVVYLASQTGSGPRPGRLQTVLRPDGLLGEEVIGPRRHLLRMLDGNGSPIFNFPQVEEMTDLETAITGQIANVEGFLQILSQETGTLTA